MRHPPPAVNGRRVKLRYATMTKARPPTITVFGTPTDITLSELALETFFPADEPTAQALRELAETLR